MQRLECALTLRMPWPTLSFAFAPNVNHGYSLTIYYITFFYTLLLALRGFSFHSFWTKLWWKMLRSFLNMDCKLGGSNIVNVTVSSSNFYSSRKCKIFACSNCSVLNLWKVWKNVLNLKTLDFVWLCLCSESWVFFFKNGKVHNMHLNLKS